MFEVVTEDGHEAGEAGRQAGERRLSGADIGERRDHDPFGLGDDRRLPPDPARLIAALDAANAAVARAQRSSCT